MQATEKQIETLKKNGYEGDPTQLTREEASALISDIISTQAINKQNQAAGYQPAVQQNNAPAAAPKKTSFSSFMAATGNKLVANTLTDSKRSSQFVANLVSAVSSNPTLAECEQVSIVSAALQAESLHFPINNSLGYVYLVPFNDKKGGMKKAQFQIGYKGYIQLAIRSGQYKDINVVEVKEGELGKFDPLNGQQFNWNPDYSKRKQLKTIGYVGQLELVNGFKKQLYVPYDEMLDHADTYSQAFNKETYLQLINGTYRGEPWKLSSFWYKNFDEMAKKTVIRKLLSKWGIMSVEMTEAYTKDQVEIKEDGSFDYIDANTEQVAARQRVETASIQPDVEFDDNTGEIIQDYQTAEMPDWMNQ